MSTLADRGHPRLLKLLPDARCGQQGRREYATAYTCRQHKADRSELSKVVPAVGATTPRPRAALSIDRDCPTSATYTLQWELTILGTRQGFNLRALYIISRPASVDELVGRSGPVVWNILIRRRNLARRGHDPWLLPVSPLWDSHLLIRPMPSCQTRQLSDQQRNVKEPRVREVGSVHLHRIATCFPTSRYVSRLSYQYILPGYLVSQGNVQ